MVEGSAGHVGLPSSSPSGSALAGRTTERPSLMRRLGWRGTPGAFLQGMTWTDIFAIVNGAGLFFAVGLVTLVGFGTLLFRRW
jgi:hypothetical protein